MPTGLRHMICTDDFGIGGSHPLLENLFRRTELFCTQEYPKYKHNKYFHERTNLKCKYESFLHADLTLPFLLFSFLILLDAV